MKVYKYNTPILKQPQKIQFDTTEINDIIDCDCRFILKHDNKLISGAKINDKIDIFCVTDTLSLVECFNAAYDADICLNVYEEFYDPMFNSFITIEDKIYSEFFRVIGIWNVWNKNWFRENRLSL